MAMLATLHSGETVLPTTDGREIRLRRTTCPTAEQKELLDGLRLRLPEQHGSNYECSADFGPSRSNLTDLTPSWAPN